jgi:hypothetical protein
LGDLNFYPELKTLWEEGVDLSTVSVNEAPARQAIIAYPNPVKDNLYLNQEADEIMLFNILGKQVLRANNVQSINLSELSNGIYMLSIIKDNHISSQKVMVNR